MIFFSFYKNQKIRKMKYDPVRIWNEEKYLNTAAIKCRYDMLNTNKESMKSGIEIGSHWKKNTPYPIMDDDLVENKIKLEDKSIKELNKRNEEIIGGINKSNLIGYLDNIDHTTEMTNALKQIKNIYKEQLGKKENSKESIYCTPKRSSAFKSNRMKLVGNSIISNNVNKSSFITQREIKNNCNSKGIIKKIYDIKPITSTTEKKSCVFSGLDKSNNGSSSCINTHLKTETTYDGNNNNSMNETNNYKNIVTTEEAKCINELKLNQNFPNVKGSKIDFSKIERRGNKISNLQILLGEHLDSKDKNKTNNTPKQGISLKKHPRHLFYKSIRLKYIKPKNDHLSNSLNTYLSYKKNKINKNTHFPERLYSMNYQYENNQKEMEITEENVEHLEKEINNQYFIMRNNVDEIFDKFIPEKNNKSENNYDEIIDYL